MRLLFLGAGLVLLGVIHPAVNARGHNGCSAAPTGPTPPVLSWPRYSPNYWPARENWSCAPWGALASGPAGGGAWKTTGSGAAPVAPIDVSRLKAADAPRLFWRGYDLYWQGDHTGAKELLTAATKLGMRDARLYYYKGLTESALGEKEAAAASLRRGAALQRQNMPSQEEIGLALERVQGPARLRIREAVLAEPER